MKYLDAILDIPKVHAVEWTCPANSSDDVRFSGIKRILEKGKMAVMWAAPEQIKDLTSRLGKSERNRVLYITETTDIREAEKLLSELERN